MKWNITWNCHRHCKFQLTTGRYSLQKRLIIKWWLIFLPGGYLANVRIFKTLWGEVTPRKSVTCSSESCLCASSYHCSWHGYDEHPQRGKVDVSDTILGQCEFIFTNPWNLQHTILIIEWDYMTSKKYMASFKYNYNNMIYNKMLSKM